MTLCNLEQRDGKYYCINCNGLPLKGNYKRTCKNNQGRRKVVAIGFSQGVGIELKRLLRKIGIVPKTGCKCKDHAKQMDDLGIEWCLQNVETIADWMEEEAKRRKMPFLRVGAKVLVKKAIRNAKRKEKFLA